jgi:hypothetical protein
METTEPSSITGHHVAIGEDTVTASAERRGRNSVVHSPR